MGKRRTAGKRKPRDVRPARAPGGWRKRLIFATGALVVIIGGLAAGPVWQEHRLQKARQLVRDRQLEAARSWLDAALEKQPERGELHFLMARLCRREGRMDAVRDHLRRAWEGGYDRQLLEREQWLALAQTGQLDEAEPQLEKLLSDPRGDAAEICEAYVNGYLRAYRFEDALRLLQAWQADFPQDPQPHYCRGMVWEHMLMSGKAAEEFEAALRLDPDRLDIRVLAGDQLSAVHRYEEAAAHYRYCLQRDPQHVEARLGYATCLMEQGHVEEPERLLKSVLEELPDNARARIGMGSLALSAGRYDEAASLLTRVCEEQPYNTAARYKLATALQSSGRVEEARPHFEYVAAAGKALSRVRVLLEKLRPDPDQVELRYEVGTTLLEYGSPADGVAWLQSVIQLQPEHSGAHRSLAAHYEALGELERAERHRRAVGRPSEGEAS